MNTAQIHKLFDPKSIAVIGASRSTKKVGGIILNNLISHNFRARIYPVNPNSDKIQGLTAYNSVLSIQETVDVAIIAIPGAYVEDVVEECGQKGIKNVIILSAGYSESGKEGLQRELRLRNIIHKYQLNLLGPNCLGLIDARSNLNLSFADSPSSYSKGKVSFISQSGAIGTAFLDWSNSNNLEISKFVSLGNKTGLNEIDFIKYFYEDPETKIILLYLENFSDGRKFFELAKLVTKTKPIIVLKPGKNESTVKAMSAHTGSLASNEKVVDVALNDSGCIRVDSIEELFNITKILDWQPALKGNKVTIITNAGGVAIEAIDQLESNNLKVVELEANIRDKLSKVLKKSSSTRNPVDLLGDALASDYKSALEKVVKDVETDAILVLLTPQLMTQSLLTAKYLNGIADKNNKVVLACFLGGEKVKLAQAYLSKEKIPNFAYTNDAAVVLGRVWSWKERLKLVSGSRYHYPTIINTNLKVDVKGEMLAENSTKKLLDKYGIKYLKSRTYDSVSALDRNSTKLKYPLVIKLIHPELIHKTDIKAVRLPIYKRIELLNAARDLSKIARDKKLDRYKLEVQPFVFKKMELILGVKKDPDSYNQSNGERHLQARGFGHTIVLGAGGIYTEVLSDVAIKLLPINRVDALEMLKSLKIGKVLLGERNQHFDYKELLVMMVNLSKLIEKNQNINSLDFNPVFVTETEAYAVDIKVFPD